MLLSELITAANALAEIAETDPEISIAQYGQVGDLPASELVTREDGRVALQ